MSGLRRFCLFVFALAGMSCLFALALPWIGPYQREATALMDNDYYYYGMQVVLAITALGILVALLRALFTPRKRKTVLVDKMGKDSITITTNAISSQAMHVVEEDGNFVAEKVRVHAKKRGKVGVDVRVRPRRTVSIAEEGRRLHDDLVEGLAVVCGQQVGAVNLEFVDAEVPEPAQDVVVERIEGVQADLQAAFAAAGDDTLAEAEELADNTTAADTSADITVPMGADTAPTARDDEPEAPAEDEGEVE